MLLLRPGDTFADCRILSLCGSGGMGVVYLAEDLLHRKVALKIVAVTNAERELRGLQQYINAAENIPGMVRIYHAGIEQEQLVYIMEAADPLNPADPVYTPKTLAAILKQQGQLPPQEALEIIRRLGEGLRKLHEARLIHRDIKPENIIFVNGVPKLCDPGLVCLQDASVSFAGTLGYLPHECFVGENLNSPDRDLYALGMVFYVAVTGEVPARYPRMPLALPVAAKKKLWPLLVRVCNASPKRRFASAADFLAALPGEIPAPDWFDKLNESFREYRLLHPHFAARFTTALLIVLLGTAAFSAYRIHAGRERARLLEKCRQECVNCEKKLNTDAESLYTQLEVYGGVTGLRAFKASLARLSADPVERLRQLQTVERQLKRLASDQLPAIPEKPDDAAAEQLSSRVRSLLSSPLGKWLPPEKRKEIAEKTALLEQRHITKKSRLKPGAVFLPHHDFLQKFVYVPAGIFRDKQGKPVRIGHGFWCGESELSSLVFSRFAGEQHQLPDRDLPKVKLCWNDLLDCCRAMTLTFRKSGSLPEGFIFRPLTTPEWCWVSRNAWHGVPEPPERKSSLVHSVYTGTPNQLGICNLGGNVSEITLPAEDEKMGNCVQHCGGDCQQKNKDAFRTARYLKYQCLSPYVGARIAVARGDLDFFEREHWYMEDRPLHWQGRIFQCITAHCGSFPQSKARELCELLGGHLSAPDDPELRKKIRQTFWESNTFPLAVDVTVKDGKFVTSSGKRYQHDSVATAFRDKKMFPHFRKGSIQCDFYEQFCGFLCDWSKEEYEKRTDVSRILKSRCIAHTFRHGNKVYALVLAQSIVFPVRQITMLLGGRLAEPRTEELREIMKKELAPWSHRPIFLGGFWKFGRWVLPDGTELKMTLKHHGFSIGDSFNSSAPGLRDGTFYSLQKAEGFLLEFPLP